jgi:hypothetical protein
MSGPFIVRHQDGGPPDWVREETEIQRPMRMGIERELADRLGMSRPYALGPLVGSCPGSERGHGLTMTSVHGGRCCERWDTERAKLLGPVRGQRQEQEQRQLS